MQKTLEKEKPICYRMQPLSDGKKREIYACEFKASGGEKVVIAIEKRYEPSVRVSGIRSGQDTEILPTRRISTKYSVKKGGVVAMSRREAAEIIEDVIGVPLPKDVGVIVNDELFKEIETISHE